MVRNFGGEGEGSDGAGRAEFEEVAQNLMGGAELEGSGAEFEGVARKFRRNLQTV